MRSYGHATALDGLLGESSAHRDPGRSAGRGPSAPKLLGNPIAVGARDARPDWRRAPDMPAPNEPNGTVGGLDRPCRSGRRAGAAGGRRADLGRRTNPTAR